MIVIEPGEVKVYAIPGGQHQDRYVDSIRLVLIDYGAGSGMIIIECFGDAYSHYWPAMSSDVRGFFIQCDPQYLAGKLWPAWVRKTRNTREQEKYLLLIIDRVKMALKELK